MNSAYFLTVEFKHFADVNFRENQIWSKYHCRLLFVPKMHACIVYNYIHMFLFPRQINLAHKVQKLRAV